MKSGWLFYVICAIAIGGMAISLLVVKKVSATNLTNQQAQFEKTSLADWQKYLDAQNDPHKLISLAKRIASNHPRLLEPLFDRAYKLAPGERDIVILDSYYHPELKKRVEDIDPLFEKNGH